MWLDAALARVGDDDPTTRARKVRAFLWILLLHQTAEFWYFPVRFWSGILEAGEYLLVLIPIGGTLFAAVALWPPTRRVGFAGVAVAQAVWVWSQFPGTANHAYLECALLGLAALLDERDESQQRLLLATGRWMLLVVLFFAGFQKLLHGYYFRGEFFAFFLPFKNFADVFQLVASDEEMRRILSLQRTTGSGPFRFESLGVIALSNGAYLAEIGGAIALFWRRTRLPAIAGVLVFLLITEYMARELFFLGLFANMLLLWLPRDTNRIVLPAFGAYYVWLLLMVSGLIPGFSFT